MSCKWTTYLGWGYLFLPSILKKIRRDTLWKLTRQSLKYISSSHLFLQCCFWSFNEDKDKLPVGPSRITASTTCFHFSLPLPRIATHPDSAHHHWLLRHIIDVCSVSNGWQTPVPLCRSILTAMAASRCEKYITLKGSSVLPLPMKIDTFRGFSHQWPQTFTCQIKSNQIYL